MCQKSDFEIQDLAEIVTRAPNPASPIIEKMRMSTFHSMVMIELVIIVRFGLPLLHLKDQDSFFERSRNWG